MPRRPTPPWQRPLLEQGEDVLDRFSKIMPTDYKRVLQARAQAELEGRDPIEAVMEASRG